MKLQGKGMEMLIHTAISAMGVNADSLLTNIRQFQGWVTNAVQHHDKRLVALEEQARANGERLQRIVELLEASGGEHFESDRDSGERVSEVSDADRAALESLNQGA